MGGGTIQTGVLCIFLLLIVLRWLLTLVAYIVIIYSVLGNSFPIHILKHFQGEWGGNSPPPLNETCIVNLAVGGEQRESEWQVWVAVQVVRSGEGRATMQVPGLQMCQWPRAAGTADQNCKKFNIMTQWWQDHIAHSEDYVTACWGH